MKSVALIVLLFYWAVDQVNAAVVPTSSSSNHYCLNVLEKYRWAVKMMDNQNGISSIPIPNNFNSTAFDDEPEEEDPYISESDSELLPNRVQRTHNLLATASLLQQRDGHRRSSCGARNKNDVESFNSESKCLPQYPTKSCPSLKENAKFRAVNGELTDRCRSTGKSFEPYAQLSHPNYNDGLYEMPKAKSCNELPKPRVVINQILRNYVREKTTTRRRIPNLLSLWMGQYITHDIGSRVDQVAGNKTIQCCSQTHQMLPPESRHPACISIELSDNEPDYGRSMPGVRCLSTVRSEVMAADLNKLAPAQQLNEVTAFLDNSNLYGNVQPVLDSLRSRIGGRLLTNRQNLFPERSNGAFYIGDARFVQSPQLMVMHAMQLREHNRVADILQQLNPHWDDERTFQEARRITVAQLQHITFHEFLPAYLDPSVLKRFDEARFSPELDAVTFNEFGSSVNRIFHGFTPNEVHFISHNGTYTTHQFPRLLHNTEIIRTHYDDICRGLLLQPIKTDGVDPSLFHALFENFPTDPGLDLISLDLQRSRDHGTPPYVEFLELLAKKPIKNWADLQPFMSKENINLLQQTYEAVEDVDLLIGSTLEAPLGDTLMGSTAQLILYQQFHRVRSADPYFYDNPKSPYPFTADQLSEIRKFDTNHLFCLNSGIDVVPQHPSIAPSTSTKLRECKTYLDLINYEVFRERPEQRGFEVSFFNLNAPSSWYW